MSRTSIRLLVCVNPVGSNKPCCGGDRGSERLAAILETELKERRIDAAVEPIHCLNRCLRGPAMRIAPGGRFFLEVTEDRLTEIVSELEALAGTNGDNDLLSGLGDAFPGG